MAVFKTLNLEACEDKAAWEHMFEQQGAVNGVVKFAELPPQLRAQIVKVDEETLSQELREIRAAERTVPESLLRMKLR
jgi:hypothetical protein